MSTITCDAKILDSICLNALCALGYGPAVAERGHAGKQDQGMAIRQLADLRAEIAKEMPKRPRSKKRFQMLLESVGNPDYGQHTPQSDPIWVAADTLKALRKAAEEYRTKWELGGGNWGNPVVLEGEKRIGYFSYNGRLWSMEKSAVNPMGIEIVIGEGK